MCGETGSQSNSNSQSYIPSWMSKAGAQLGQTAANVASTPYQAYTGPTMAAFGPTFQTAEDMTTARANSADPNFSAASAALMKGMGLAGDTASAPISSLMSQYTDAALKPTLDAIQRQAAVNNQGLAQGATMAGAFGDTGFGAQRALNDRNTTDAISGATGQAYDKAYSQALQTHNDALTQLFAGANGATGVGTASNNAQTSIGQLLASMGIAQQSAGQTGINTAINVNNMNQQGWLQMLQAGSGILSSLPHDTNSVGQGFTQQPDNTGFGLLGSLLSAVPGTRSPISLFGSDGLFGGGSTSFGGFDYGSSDIASAAQAGVQSGLKFDPKTGSVW